MECGYLSSTADYAETRDVMDRMRQQPPTIKIVFVTPEKVARSDATMRLFDTLHHRGTLVSALQLACSAWRCQNMLRPQPRACGQ